MVSEKPDQKKMPHRARHDRQQQQPRQDHEEQQEREPRMKRRQVRRRLHTTSRLFHGRPPLDMAEARREIAAALRTHRAAAAAATRRSRDQHLPQLQQQQQEEHEQVVLWGRPPVSCDAFFSGHQLCDSPPADFTAAGAGASCCSSSSTLRCLAPPPATIGGGIGRLACSLPARPLGLSLSFHGFAGSSVHDDVKNSDDYLIEPSPESSSSVCASPLAAAAALSHGGSSQAPADAAAENEPSSRPVPLHPVPEGLYPIGERRGAERSDDARAAADVATPAWWGDLLDQTTEDGGGKLGSPARPAGQEGGGAAAGEQGIATGIGKLNGVLEMHLAAADDDYYHYYHQGDGDGDGDGEDITLPCMEIGEIEGWDGEWFFSP